MATFALSRRFFAFELAFVHPSVKLLLQLEHTYDYESLVGDSVRSRTNVEQHRNTDIACHQSLR